MVLPPRVAAEVPVGVTAKSSAAPTRPPCRPAQSRRHPRTGRHARQLHARLQVQPLGDEGAHSPAALTTALPLATIEQATAALLITVHDDMYARALAERDARLKHATAWPAYMAHLDAQCMVMVPWCRGTPCEVAIKARSAEDAVVDERAPSWAQRACASPFGQPPLQGHACLICGEDAVCWGVFGRSC
jgi:hypothetical protein